MHAWTARNVFHGELVDPVLFWDAEFSANVNNTKDLTVFS